MDWAWLFIQPFFRQELRTLKHRDFLTLLQTCRELRQCDHILQAVRSVSALSLSKYIEQNNPKKFSQWSVDVISTTLFVTKQGLRKLLLHDCSKTIPNLLIVDAICIGKPQNQITIGEHRALQRLFPKLRGRYFDYQYLSTKKSKRPKRIATETFPKRTLGLPPFALNE